MSEQEQNYAVVNFEEYAMNTGAVVRQVNVIQDVMKSVMKIDEHYGTIPGTKKPSLLKPGAEKLSLVFRLRPEYLITRSDLGNGHREYEITCTLFHIPTGQPVGQGVGSATTMEAKYRFRGGEKEGTGQPVPKEYWNLRKTDPTKAQDLIGGPGFAPGKIDGPWEICSIGEKVEHDNPADYYNTVLKMAKKRAHVDAILTATAASDIFTQDVEDLAANGVMPAANKDEKKDEKKKADPAKKAGNGQAAGETVSINIASIVPKEGQKSNGQKFTLYTITDDKGATFRTFDKKIADSATEARDNGVGVKITYKKGQYGNDVMALEHDVPPAAEPENGRTNLTAGEHDR